MMVFISFLRYWQEVFVIVFICRPISKKVITIVDTSAVERLFLDFLVKIATRLRCLDTDKSVSGYFWFFMVALIIVKEIF